MPTTVVMLDKQEQVTKDENKAAKVIVTKTDDTGKILDETVYFPE